MTGFLLDTNVLSELRKKRPNIGLVEWVQAVDEFKLHLSVITIGEFRTGIEMVSDAKQRGALETWLVSDVLPRFEGRIIPFDIGVAERWGRMEGRARRGTGKLPVIDAMLAATALHHDLTLITNNETDFSRTGVGLLNPWV